MAFNFNGNTPKKILYNGLNVAKLIYNGVVVWMSKVLATIEGILPLTLTNSTGDDLVDYKIYGNTEQLPQGYTRVEYIESTGTQYIDTNFIPNQDTRIKAKIITRDKNIMGNKAIFGSRASATSRHYGVTIGGQNVWWTGYGTSNINTNITVLRDTLFEIEKNKNVTILNDSVVSTSPSQTFTCPGNLYLFCMNQNGTTFYSRIELYSCKIWDNDVLIRNFIPCKNPSNEIGMYDLVNGVFYTNAGTGTFNVGSVVPITSVGDLVTDTSDINYGKYKIPLLTNSHTTDIYLNKPLRRASRLPYGYTEIEHIRSTGTQYIDTGVKGNLNTEAIIKVNQITASSQNSITIFGDSSNNSKAITINLPTSISNKTQRFGDKGIFYTTPFSLEVNYVLKINKSGLYVDNTKIVTFNTTTEFETESNLRLFRIKGIVDSFYNGTVKIYYCKIYDDGVLVRNFIPCKNPSNVVGMYDTVNDVFYSNAGTDSFIAGAEVETVYYTDYLDYENQKVVRNVDDNDKGIDTPVEESVVLPAVPTDEGTVTVDVDTEIAPSYAEVVYYKNDV